MKIFKLFSLTAIFSILLGIVIWFALYDKNLVRQKTIQTENYGTISIAYPFFGEHAQVLAFIDTQKIDPNKLASQIAHLGVRAAIVDGKRALKAFSSGGKQCLDPVQIATSITSLRKIIPISEAKRLVVSGIGDGALIPFFNAETPSEQNITNLSIGFSVVLPPYVILCPSFITRQQGQQKKLLSVPDITGNWHSVWVDYPAAETAVFVRKISKAKTSIAPYDTPDDTVLTDELQKVLGPTNSPSSPLPVVEVPAPGANQTVTLFYSGDGGWRDLDRIVAGEMARQGNPVVGIDTLRAFWNRKTPEQSADELARTMEYYRKAWGAKNFVLAGYSFGADILPALYNRLTPADQDSVHLLVLLSVSKEADFEIHVTGWLGKDSSGLPISPELSRMPANKILCVYGRKEKAETACTDLISTQAELLELPGGHHFDEDYPKLTRLILKKYQAVGIHGTADPHPSD